MKVSALIALFCASISMSIMTTGCWTDIDRYSEFVCERFGGDFDNDGVCSRNDCNDYDPNIYAGAPCDDGDELTVDDAYNEDCECVGN